MLQTISPSLKAKFTLVQLNKLKVCTCQAYTTARWHMAFVLYSHLIAFVHLCYMDRCHLLASYKIAKSPLFQSQFNGHMANEHLSIQR